MEEVPQSYGAVVGDVLDFYYTIRGWGKQGQIESLVNDLDRDPRWEVKEYDLDNSKLRIRVKVLINPLPVILIVAAIGAIGTGLFVFLSLDKVEKVVASPMGALSLIGIAGAGILLLLRGFKRCLLYTSPSPRDATLSRMPSSA